MTQRWHESVQEHRQTLEAWADSDLPLSEDIAELLKRADVEEVHEIEVATP